MSSTTYDYFVVGYGEADEKIAVYLHELGIDPVLVRKELRLGTSKRTLGYEVGFETMLKTFTYAIQNVWFQVSFYRRSRQTDILTTVPKTEFSKHRNHPATRDTRKALRDAVNRKVRSELKKYGL